MSQNWRSWNREGRAFWENNSFSSTHKTSHPKQFLHLPSNNNVTPVNPSLDDRGEIVTSSLWRLLSLPMCPLRKSDFFWKPQFVFYSGSGFSQPSSWEHDSILYIKAKIQLKLRIREQSREQLPLPWRSCYWTRQFLQTFSSYCCPKCKRDAPGASAATPVWLI